MVSGVTWSSLSQKLQSVDPMLAFLVSPTLDMLQTERCRNEEQTPHTRTYQFLLSRRDPLSMTGRVTYYFDFHSSPAPHPPHPVHYDSLALALADWIVIIILYNEFKLNRYRVERSVPLIIIVQLMCLFCSLLTESRVRLGLVKLWLCREKWLLKNVATVDQWLLQQE